CCLASCKAVSGIARRFLPNPRCPSMRFQVPSSTVFSLFFSGAQQRDRLMQLLRRPRKAVVTEVAFPYHVCESALEAATMTVTESKALKIGSRVYWQGKSADAGSITGASWDAVMIAWDNGKTAIVHHGDMRQIANSPAKAS